MATNDNNAITTGICAHDAIGVQSIVLCLRFHTCRVSHVTSLLHGEMTTQPGYSRHWMVTCLICALANVLQHLAVFCEGLKTYGAIRNVYKIVKWCAVSVRRHGNMCLCSCTVMSRQQAVLCPQIHVITTNTTAASGICELSSLRLVQSVRCQVCELAVHELSSNCRLSGDQKVVDIHLHWQWWVQFY